MKFEEKTFKANDREYTYYDPIPQLYDGGEINHIHSIGCDKEKDMNCVFHTTNPEKFLKVKDVDYINISSEINLAHAYINNGSELFFDNLLTCKIRGEIKKWIDCKKEIKK